HAPGGIQTPVQDAEMNNSHQEHHEKESCRNGQKAERDERNRRVEHDEAQAQDQQVRPFQAAVVEDEALRQSVRVERGWSPAAQQEPEAEHYSDPCRVNYESSAESSLGQLLQHFTASSLAHGRDSLPASQFLEVAAQRLGPIEGLIRV